MNKAFWGGLVFLLFASYMLKHAVQSFRLFKKSTLWPSAEGIITECTYSLTEHKTNLRNFFVTYQYQVDGETYQNNRIALYTIVRKEEAEPLAEQFKEGNNIPVYHNPEKPEESCLVVGEPQKKYSDLILATMGVLIGVGITFAGYFGYIGK
ncbi:MAG: DUF3592 domain-containing protein [Desulfobacterales bacterium]|nr:DUF3592 domain-containing protein [Desulfobacterales bacterium]